ncbi:MAG TPA: DUF935 family protein, partial [Blastocatellia bacterium]
ERRVLPASELKRDKKIAEFIEETLEDYFDVTSGEMVGFNNVLWEALDAVGKGVAMGEILFAPGTDRIFIKDVRFKPQHLFAFGEGELASYWTASYLYPQVGPIRIRPGLIIPGMNITGQLPQEKFLVHTFQPYQGNRWGVPLLRKCFWASWIKRNGLRLWLRYIEKGSGSVVARYPDGAAEAEQSKALAAAKAIFDESAVALPSKFLLQIMEHVRNIGSSHKELIDDFCNNEITRVILGQTLTTRGSEGGGGSRALGNVHQQVRDEKIEADAKSLMVAVNRNLIWPLVLYNFGPVAKPPTWIIKYDPERDYSADSIYLQRLQTMGLKISKKFVYDRFQLAEPEDEGDTLQVPAGDDSVAGPQKPPAVGVDTPAEFAEKLVELIADIDDLNFKSRILEAWVDGSLLGNPELSELLPDPLRTLVVEYAEAQKKTPLDGPRNRQRNNPSKRSPSKTERFKKLRPSTID